MPAINLAKVKPNGTYPSEYETERATESPLHLLGYNVGQADDFSDAYRQELLGRIMDCGALSKYRICSYLELFISQGRGRRNMNMAVSKWERDLNFVEHYHINQQERVRIISIQPY